MDDKVKQRLFQQSRGCHSKINDQIWPVFDPDWDFIHVPHFCKFQKDLIKTEWVMLMTKSNRGFFSNEGDETLRLMIQPSQFFNLSEISSTVCSLYLQVSGTYVHNWMSYTDEKLKQKLFQQSRGRNSKINNPIWLVFEPAWCFIHVHLICKFQERSMKTKRVMVMTYILHYKSV